MLPSWIIDKIYNERIEQEKRDRDSWDRQPRAEVDDEFRRPPVEMIYDKSGDRAEGGICEIDFSI